MPKIHYSTRHFPAYLKQAMRVLAMRQQQGGTTTLWRIHNRALKIGLRQLWAEAGLGAFPSPQGRMANGRDELPNGAD